MRYAGALEVCLSCDLILPAEGSQIGQIKAIAGSIPYAGRAFAQSLASGSSGAHAVTKRVLHAWRSGGVAAADQVTNAEGPAVMLSQDTQEGTASLQRYGPGDANFNNR
jgi:enoyl-CoA hydratase